MPKQDRFAEQKKESAKAKKKVEQNAAKSAEAEPAPAPASAAASATSRARAPAAGAGGGSAFARAARAQRDGEESAEDAPEPVAPAAAERSVTSRKETTRRRPAAGAGQNDFELLLEGERSARRQRILDRFLRLILLGFLLDYWKGQGSAREVKDQPRGKKKGPNSGKNSGKETDEPRSLWSFIKKVDIFGGPFLMLAFTTAMFAARLAEEGYTPDHRGESEANLYEILGITNDASVLDIRKAYKALALSWHPDKNPDCETCPTRFAKISEAYETLSNPENRKAYDQRKTRKGSLASMASVELTGEDFDHRVLRSNEVWIVQVYDPSDGLCQHFHPVWEDVAHSHQHVAKFGRIDATKQRKALDFLPHRVVVMPLVFRFARGSNPDTLLWNGGEDQGSGTLSRFIIDGYPQVQQLNTGAEVNSWWAGRTPRVLLAGPMPGPRRGAKALEYLQVLRMAHLWSEFVEFASVDVKLARDVLPAVKPADGASWSLTTRAMSSGTAGTQSFADLKEVPVGLQDIVILEMKHRLPPVTVRNHQQLCSSNSLGTVTRTFCLVLVDVGDHRVPGLLEDLNASQSAYAQEVLDLTSTGEDAEEPFHVQAIRVATRSSRWPWQPVAAGPGFRPLWSNAASAPAFVVELETQRIAPVKNLKNLKDLYQNIAYEDLKFHEIPESLSLMRALPDPETTLRRELSMLLSSPISALTVFILLAFVAAVLPELSAGPACLSLAIACALVLVAWPRAFRRCFLPFWCTAFPNSFECQVNI